MAFSPKVVGNLAGQMLGYALVTKQTPPEGVVVNKVRLLHKSLASEHRIPLGNNEHTASLTVVQVMVAQALDLARETYFAILMDRDSNGPVMVSMHTTPPR
jgi:succinyl-CoA synthetase beta subunit